MPLRKSKLRFAIPLEELVALQKKLCGLFVRWWWMHCCWGNVMWTKFECSVALATEIGISDDSMQLHTPSVYYTVPTGFIWHPWYKCQCQNMVRYDHKTFPYYLLKQKEISNLGIKQCWMNQWLIPLHMTIHFGYKSNLRWCDSMTAFFWEAFSEFAHGRNGNNTIFTSKHGQICTVLANCYQQSTWKNIQEMKRTKSIIRLPKQL